MRGAAPSATCPRCGTVTPPSDEPLVHCLTCKLSFDPRAEPVARPSRRAPVAEATERGPAGIVVARTSDAWTIRIPEQRFAGWFLLAVGLGLAGVFLAVRQIPGQQAKHLVALVLFALAFVYLGVGKVLNDLTIRVDEHEVIARLRPVRLQRDVMVLHRDVVKLRAVRGDSAKYPWVVLVDTSYGSFALAGIRHAGKKGEDAAAFVAEAVGEGLVATAPETAA